MECLLTGTPFFHTGIEKSMERFMITIWRHDNEGVFFGSRQDPQHHGPFVLLTLEGVRSIDDALPLKGKIITARREDVSLDEGSHFIVDLIGLEARHAETGAILGKVTEILEYPAHDLYVVKGDKQYFIPDVPEFVKGIYEEEGYIAFAPLEGMGE